LACGDAAEPTAVVIDSPLSLSASGQLSGERSCRSAPSCFGRGFDGGQKINGVKVHLGVDKYGIPLAIDVSPANVHDTKGIIPVLRELSGKASGDRRWVTSATGASVYPRQAGSSALPSSPSLAAVMASSSRPESAGWWSAPLPGFLITGG
jgi:hypothetical protein